MKRSKHLKKIINLKAEHLQKEIELRAKMSDIAINKAENSILERQESSNGKYSLLKEQSGTFATKEEVAVLSRLIYMGVGALAAIQFILYFLKD